MHALDDALLKSRRLIGWLRRDSRDWVGRVWSPWLPRLLCVAVSVYFLCDVQARLFVEEHALFVVVWFFWDIFILELIPLYRLFRRKVSKSKVHGNSI